jgi:hypothetical protein
LPTVVFGWYPGPCTGGLYQDCCCNNESQPLFITGVITQ